MIKGIGIDIVEIKRVAGLLEEKPRFVEKILSEEEQRIFEKLTLQRKVEWLAGRFAGKEAYAKAVGTGITAKLRFQDIVILNDELGKPYIAKPDAEQALISISHSDQYAVAQVVLL